MDDYVELPKTLEVGIRLGLLLTFVLFVSIYVVLFILGWWVAIWFEVPDLLFEFGLVFVIIGLIPVVCSIFIKFKDSGIIAEKKQFPELFKIINKVSSEFGMKMPSKVLIVPTDSIYVTGFFKKKIGVGIVGLEALTKSQFEAILRHEFGHFYGNDTMVGALIARVQLSLEGSGKFGKGWWNNVPYLYLALIGLVILGFAKLYSFLFRLMTSVHSRQVEYRADYVAAATSNDSDFATALLNYSAYSLYFNAISYDSIANLLEQGRSFLSIYDFVRENYRRENSKKVLQNLLSSDKESLFSSHPKLTKRLSKLGVDTDKLKLQKLPKISALSLIKDRKYIETEFTKLLTNNLHTHLLYEDAVAREGKCRYCEEQFERLQDLLDHEADCDGEK
jgi:heat shock protein HtpX